MPPINLTIDYGFIVSEGESTAGEGVEGHPKGPDVAGWTTFGTRFLPEDDFWCLEELTVLIVVQ